MSVVAVDPTNTPYPPDPSAGFTTISSRCDEHVAAMRVVGAQPRRDVGDQRLFVEVVADELGHERVHDLVVGDADARRVRERDVARPPRAHEPAHAERGIGAEHFGVEEEVVDAAVDHVDAHEAVDRAHVDAVVAVDDEVLALHEVRAHLLRERRVLEVRGVEDARREHRDHRRVARARRERGEQRRRACWGSCRPGECRGRGTGRRRPAS